MGREETPEWRSVKEAIGPYEGDDSDKSWIILFPKDFDTFMKDGADNLALLVDKHQAQELKRLAEESIERAEDD